MFITLTFSPGPTEAGTVYLKLSMWIIAAVADELAGAEPPGAAVEVPCAVLLVPEDPQPARIDSATTDPVKISPARPAGDRRNRPGSALSPGSLSEV
jgi:hypothetical protein